MKTRCLFLFFLICSLVASAVDGNDDHAGFSTASMGLPQISGPTFVCYLHSAHYVALGDSGSHFDWIIQGGHLQGNSNGPEIDLIWTDTVQAQIELTEFTLNGQTNSVDQGISVYPVPSSVVRGRNSECIGSSVAFYTTDNSPDLLRHWSLDGGGTIAMNGSDSVGILWTVPGVHHITLRSVHRFTGCDADEVFTVHVDSMPAVSFPASALSVCAPFELAISGNNSAQGYQYNWNFGDSIGSAEANPSHHYEESGHYPLSLYVTGRQGCERIMQTTIEVKESAKASFDVGSNSDTNYVGSTTFSFANNSAGANSYLWNFGDGNLSHAAEPTHVYAAPGEFLITLSAIAPSGCVDNFRTSVEVISPQLIFVPSAFSPNGDNVNDYFSVVTNNISKMKVTVYNDWGQSVYSSEEPGFRWDGIFQGHLIDQGLYGYRIQAEGAFGEKFDLQGKLTVLR